MITNFLKFRVVLYLLVGGFCFFQDFLLGIKSNLLYLLISVFLGLGSSVVLNYQKQVLQKRSFKTGFVLIFDCLILTALIFSSGGANSPLTIFYLLILVLSALFESRKYTWFIYAFTIICYDLLFIVGQSMTHHMHHQSHLQSMYFAYIVVGALVTFYLTKLIEEYREAERALVKIRNKQYQLSLITSLLAESAHKLGTPLATMQLALDDLNLEHASLPESKVLTQQVQKIKQIVFELRNKAGQGSSPKWEEKHFGDFIEHLKAQYPKEKILWQYDKSGFSTYKLPYNVIQGAICGLIENAIQAGGDREVVVEISLFVSSIQVLVIDFGRGVSQDIINSINQPFKESGQSPDGMGLGIYIANLVCESLGGSLKIQSESGKTTVKMEFRYQHENTNY